MPHWDELGIRQWMIANPSKPLMIHKNVRFACDCVYVFVNG